MTKLGLWVDDLFHNISRWKGNDFWALWSNILHVCQQECKQAGCCLDRGGEEGLYWAASHRTNPQTRKADAWLTASIDSQPESIYFFAVACFFLCTSFLCHSTTFIFHVFQCKPSFFLIEKSYKVSYHLLSELSMQFYQRWSPCRPFIFTFPFVSQAFLP